jgi:hypothetical protein
LEKKRRQPLSLPPFQPNPALQPSTRSPPVPLSLFPCALSPSASRAQLRPIIAAARPQSPTGGPRPSSPTSGRRRTGGQSPTPSRTSPRACGPTWPARRCVSLSGPINAAAPPAAPPYPTKTLAASELLCAPAPATLAPAAASVLPVRRWSVAFEVASSSAAL